MRDIPLFTTSNGVASLYFKKIPFTKEAFVEVRDSLSCEELIKECVDICTMAGAERVYATGHNDLTRYRVFSTVARYCVLKDALSNTDASALPVMMEQLDWWRQLYNQKMASVATAAPLTVSETESLICDRKAFCIYKACAVVGIGVAYDGQIHAVASTVPGGGRDAVLALAEILEGPAVTLLVASTNHKAISLYKSLGFQEREPEAIWYQIF